MTFQVGLSGNPNGRPKGTGSRQQIFNLLVEPHRDALIKTAIDLALNGNEAMLRLFLDRILPAKPTSEPINIELTQDISKAASLIPMSIEFFRALEKQELTPEQFKILVASLREHRENLLAIELSKQVHDLEMREGVPPKGDGLLMGLLKSQAE